MRAYAVAAAASFLCLCLYAPLCLYCVWACLHRRVLMSRVAQCAYRTLLLFLWHFVPLFSCCIFVVVTVLCIVSKRKELACREEEKQKQKLAAIKRRAPVPAHLRVCLSSSYLCMGGVYTLVLSPRRDLLCSLWRMTTYCI